MSASVLRQLFSVFTLLIAALLVVDAVFLMSTGLVNFGVVLPLCIGCGLILLRGKWLQFGRWRSQRVWRQKVWMLAQLLAGAWLLSLVLFFIFLQRTNDATGLTGKNTAVVKAIMILGSGSLKCSASPTLAARLDLGLEWARRLPAAKVLVTGGKNWTLPCAEAQIMGDYLRAHGLAAGRIIQEERSTTTYENLLFSQPLLEKNAVTPHDEILIVSSDFHVLRARMIARRLGWSSVHTAGATTPLYIRYNDWLREYFSFIKGFLLRMY